MLYKEIRKKASMIDHFIEENTGPFRMPMKEVDAIIRYQFPECYIKSSGWFKTVFKLCSSKTKSLVLKVGKKSSIEEDMKIYKRLPESIRNKYFARVYWHTKYCILQEYGEEAKPTLEEISHLRSIALKYGLKDIKRQNIRNFDGKLKIVDSTIITLGFDKINFLKDYIRINLS